MPTTSAPAWPQVGRDNFLAALQVAAAYARVSTGTVQGAMASATARGPYGPVTVSAVWVYEGLRGDYDPRDPEDYPVVRLDIWEVARPGVGNEPARSYATLIDARTAPALLRSACAAIAGLLALIPPEHRARVWALPSHLDTGDVALLHQIRAHSHRPRNRKLQKQEEA